MYQKDILPIISPALVCCQNWKIQNMHNIYFIIMCMGGGRGFPWFWFNKREKCVSSKWINRTLNKNAFEETNLNLKVFNLFEEDWLYWPRKDWIITSNWGPGYNVFKWTPTVLSLPIKKRTRLFSGNLCSGCFGNVYH